MITKKAELADNYKRTWRYTNSASEAWSEIIEIYKKSNPNGSILLPAYIGWSPNEGSGIYDSVVKSGLSYSFYNLDLHLQIDLKDFKQKVLNDKNQLVLLVHYFGFPDNNSFEITAWLRERNIFFVEDCAHAWLTDLIGGKCGREGNYSFYSLHKILPVNNGGLLVNNKPLVSEKSSIPYNIISYDYSEIFNKRISNYRYLSHLLKDLKDDFTMLHENLEVGICPQTLPVIVEKYNRDLLYKEMNDIGFGMVSLYHTMINELSEFSCDAVNILSKKIINFPIHQDVTKSDIDEMIKQLKEIIYV